MDKFMNTVENRRLAQERDDQIRQDNLNELIMDSVLKKYKTTFIGAIDAVDKAMGFLWGHGIDPADLSDDQRSWLPVREKFRKMILDNGNKQMRDAEDQLAAYDFVYKKDFLP